MQDRQDDWPADDYATWIGRKHEAVDMLTAGLVDRFTATVPLAGSNAATGSASGHLPPGLHWCLAPLSEQAGRLGPDGHPAMGVHLPPIKGMRRMWAGGALAIHGRLQIGDEVRRTTTIRSINQKQGRSGALAFIELSHEFTTARGACITERQDLVYRPAPGELPAQASKDGHASPSSSPVMTIPTDPVLLFRYSALTFNGHRIHYDRPYATDVEGYRGLVVHGPLIATLLANLGDAHLGGIKAFEFRARAPLFCGEQLALYLTETETGCSLEARGIEDSRLIMTATASAA